MTTKSTSKPKQTVADLQREWAIPVGAWMRYAGLAGVYWYFLSRQVRKEEWEKYGGKCFTCERPLKTWQAGQCGHIIAVRDCGEYLKFHRNNLVLQEAKCNDQKMTPMAAALNLLNYNKRHGEGAWQRLYEMRNTKKKPYGRKELRALIEALPSYQEGKRLREAPSNSFAASVVR